MRLARLDLIRYGKFTGRRLDFGPDVPGRPDLHVVYGPNEAGKSTAFAAYLDLLFGIRALKEPNYAFLHPYPTMRIGARLDLAGGPRDVIRIRRQQATLLDAEERPIDEGLIAAELGGIGRESYRSMFSLDDASIEEGGKEILASQGDLGHLLFSGSAGTAGISQALSAMREEADAFFRSGAQKTRLNVLKVELDALKSEREAIDTQAATYRHLLENRDRAAAAHDAALKARGAAAARRDEIGRLMAALPRLTKLRVTRGTLAPLLALPDPPAAWAGELQAIERDGIRLGEEARGIAEETEALARELDGLTVDEAALAAGDDHLGLAALRAAAVTAGKDLPRRRSELAQAEGAVAAALRRLGRPAGSDPDDAVLPATLTGTLRDLITERSGIVARREDARREAEAAARDLAAARQALSEAGGGVVDGAALIRLRGMLEAWRDADPATRLRTAERARSASAEGLAEALRRLAPWGGTADQLAGLVLPASRDVEAWAAGLAEAEADMRRRDSEAEDLLAERDALRAEVDALARLAGPISDAEAIALRAAREKAWTEHRTRLDAASADLFEDALRRDDATVAARFGQAADVARLKEASLTLASIETRLRGTVERGAAAGRRRDDIREALASALAAVVPPLPALTPAQLMAWLARVAPALQAATASRDATEARRAAEDEVEGWRARLAGALGEADIAHETATTLDALVLLARAAVDRGTAQTNLATRVGDEERRMRHRALARDRAEEDASDWQRRWEVACRSCWLGEAEEAPSPAAVGEVLDLLGALSPDLFARADRRHRIAAMEADQARFAARLAPLATALGLAAVTGPERVLEMDAVVERRVGEARSARAARDGCRTRLAAIEHRRIASAKAIAANDARADVLKAFFDVATLAEAGAALKRCDERDRLRREAETLADDIRGALRVADIAEAEKMLDGIDAGALEAERDTVAAGYDSADLDLRYHHTERAAAEQALQAVGGDDAVARIDARRRVALLDIEEQARRFLKLRGGIAAAEQALAAYRDRHRSAMLQRASQAFATISRGAYTGLAAQPGDKGEILIALPAAGPSKQAGDLSKGTRFQLYLALRAAGYHAFAETRRAVPFVADDIMETFDDFRAEEAFRVFTDMAKAGQVIYLTHHRHLVDIARAACPTVTVHELGTP